MNCMCQEACIQPIGSTAVALKTGVVSRPWPLLSIACSLEVFFFFSRYVLEVIDNLPYSFQLR